MHWSRGVSTVPVLRSTIRYRQSVGVPVCTVRTPGYRYKYIPLCLSVRSVPYLPLFFVFLRAVRAIVLACGTPLTPTTLLVEMCLARFGWKNFGPSAPIFGRSTRFYFLIFLSSTEGSRQLCDHLSIISHESKESKMMKQSSIRGGIPVNKRELGDYTETEFLYFSECREKFLGDDVVERGMISQEKFADAYSTSCVKFYSEGNSCPGPNFSMFPESLQTVFYGAACKSMSDPSACGMNLNSLPMKIGYIVSRDEMPDVQMHVEGMCLGMMDQVFRK